MKAVVAAFNHEKALVGAFSVITNLRMELFEALVCTPSTQHISRAPVPWHSSNTDIHIFSLPRIRLRLILIMKCILWALTVSYNERECSSNASATKIKGETFKMHLILKVLLSISRRKVQCKINWKTSLSKSFHIYFLEDHHYLIFALCWREKIECLQDRNQHRVAAGQ